MKNIRVIPRLDIKNNTVVKGIHLEGLRVVGDPQVLAKKYYDDGADEILYMDVVASLYERNNLGPIIEQTARNVFIPLTVGGGIRTVDDITQVLRMGADKVAINTAAVKNPDFISEAANRFGSQCIVGSIESQYKGSGKWEVYTDTGREASGKDAIIWGKEMERLGAGELLITSITAEGVQKGFELDLVLALAPHVKIPVIACGGAGLHGHVIDVVVRAHADAVACASIFHYEKSSISELKASMAEAGIPVRRTR